MIQFSQSDIQQIKQKSISQSAIEQQINRFKTGFANIRITKPATINSGIIKLSDKQAKILAAIYNKQSADKTKVKFVPASGAASRMFKDLFELLNEADNINDNLHKLIQTDKYKSAKQVLSNIKDFAFYKHLQKCIKDNGQNIDDLIQAKDYVSLLQFLLLPKGLNYGNLPKGLLLFHKTDEVATTPFEEHLTEGALYANSDDNVHIHFTVSENHTELFKEHLKQVTQQYEQTYNKKYMVEFSVQDAKTDTIAVDLQNNIFHYDDGKLLFRPAGHGALIHNLNNINADIIFIKNIDNVTPKNKNADTILYKQALAGILLQTQQKVFNIINKLNSCGNETISVAKSFIEDELNTILPKDFEEWNSTKQKKYLLNKLNRPLRVCGMVKNDGEPGGGPFWVQNTDNSLSLQIVEASQIPDNKKDILQQATHFNPVDIVCSTKDYKGNKFNLHKFVDAEAGFISTKSYKGQSVKALELPGLWNGAMSDWNTLFVEVPSTTFAPVKNIADLLKNEHL